MTVQRVITTVALVSPVGTVVATLDALEVEWTQDEGASPFTIATVTVAAPPVLQFAMMRPGAGYYLSIGADDVTLGATEPYLLRIVDRGRTLDGRVRLQATSGETDLQAFTPAAVDRSNWEQQGSVIAIVNDVLDKAFGAGKWGRYVYGPANAFGEDIGFPAFRTYQAATNMIANGGFESAATTGWAGSGATVAVSTIWAASGQYSLRITPNSASTNSYAYQEMSVRPNTKYTISATIRLGAAMTGSVDAAARRILVSTSVGGQGYELGRSSQAQPTGDRTERLTRTFTTPAMLDNNTIRVRLYHGQNSTNPSMVLWDQVMLVEGDGTDTDGVTPIAYFDGATVDGVGGYNYDWQGDPYASSSTRTPIVARDPETLTWSPGQSAWDFLAPILQTVGVRLWSDTYTVAGGAVVARVFLARNEFGIASAPRYALDTFNLFELEQVDSWTAEFPDGMPMFADQVILHYTWSDNLGVSHEQYDVYPPTGKKPYYLELDDTPFAGVGRAQGIYNRISARATMFSGLQWFDRGTHPGRQITITSAGAGGSAVGYIDATTHDPMRGTTRFRTKQTIAYTPESWFAATGSWASQTGSWADDI